MDDLGVPPFHETSIYAYIVDNRNLHRLIWLWWCNCLYKIRCISEGGWRHKRNMFWIADVNPWQFKAAGTSFMFTNQKLSQSEIWLVKRYGYNVGPPFYEIAKLVNITSISLWLMIPTTYSIHRVKPTFLEGWASHPGAILVPGQGKEIADGEGSGLFSVSVRWSVTKIIPKLCIYEPWTKYPG